MILPRHIKKNIELVDLAISANREDYISIKIIKKIIKDNNITDVLEYFNGSAGNKAKDSQKIDKLKLLIEMIVDEKEISLALRQNTELKTPKI